MDNQDKKRKTCPPEAIRFADLAPKRDVRGGNGNGDKILFGTLDDIVRRGLAIRHEHDGESRGTPNRGTES